MANIVQNIADQNWAKEKLPFAKLENHIHLMTSKTWRRLTFSSKSTIQGIFFHGCHVEGNYNHQCLAMVLNFPDGIACEAVCTSGD